MNKNPEVKDSYTLNRLVHDAKQDAEAGKEGCIVVDREKYAHQERKYRLTILVVLVLYLAIGFWIGYSSGYKEGLLNSKVCTAIVQGARNALL